jgi:hypothetical protein
VFQVKEENIEIHDMGIVLFKNVLPMQDHGYILDFAKSVRLQALKDDFTFINDDLGNPLYAINRSGHRYALEDVEIGPVASCILANIDIGKGNSGE